MAFKAFFQLATNQRFLSADQCRPAAMISPPDNIRSNQQGTRG